MTTRYSPLFSVDFLHEYFPEGKCPVVTMVPDQTTYGVMQRLGIRMVKKEYDTTLYYNDGDSPAGQLLTVDEPVRLTFILRSDDVLFHNYTQPEEGKTDGAPRYLHNLDGDELTDAPATELPANWQNGDLGLLTIYVGETVSGETRILNNGVVTPAEYAVAFAVRETLWRYYLIDQGQPGHENFELLDAASGEVVTAASNPPTTKTLPDGTEAILLPAPSSLPLHQRPGARFTLQMKIKGSSRSTPITMPLPSAGAERLSADSAEGPFYSDLYIYL